MGERKEKADLEQLLNSLIDKGWKPRGEKVNKVIKTGIDEFGDGYVLFDGELNGYKQRGCNMTELVSKSSGLWQFVCENGMINVDETEVYYFWLKRKGTLDRGHYYLSEASEDIRTNNFEYRLIESSLKDESELEDFLLSNIKVEGEEQKHS